MIPLLKNDKQLKENKTIMTSIVDVGMIYRIIFLEEGRVIARKMHFIMQTFICLLQKAQYVIKCIYYQTGYHPILV